MLRHTHRPPRRHGQNARETRREKMICPFKRVMCNGSSCPLWVRDDDQCAIRLAAVSLSEISTAHMTVNKGEKPEPVEEDLPFC